MAVVGIWAALEEIFSPDKNELTFRVSLFLATYLESTGPRRRALQKEIRNAYGKRSRAAHGQAVLTGSDLAVAFELMKRVLLNMVIRQKVPSATDLEDLLFACTAEETRELNILAT